MIQQLQPEKSGSRNMSYHDSEGQHDTQFAYVQRMQVPLVSIVSLQRLQLVPQLRLEIVFLMQV